MSPLNREHCQAHSGHFSFVYATAPCTHSTQSPVAKSFRNASVASDPLFNFELTRILVIAAKQKWCQGCGCPSFGRMPAYYVRSSEFNPRNFTNQKWWHIPGIPTLGKWKEEENKPRAILDYMGVRAILGYMGEVESSLDCMRIFFFK